MEGFPHGQNRKEGGSERCPVDDRKFDASIENYTKLADETHRLTEILYGEPKAAYDRLNKEVYKAVSEAIAPHSPEHLKEDEFKGAAEVKKILDALEAPDTNWSDVEAAVKSFSGPSMLDRGEGAQISRKFRDAITNAGARDLYRAGKERDKVQQRLDVLDAQMTTLLEGNGLAQEIKRRYEPLLSEAGTQLRDYGADTLATHAIMQTIKDMWEKEKKNRK